MKKDTKSLLWGILAGSVVGSVTALLFAPKAGKELRKDIAEGTAEAAHKVQEIAGAASDKGTELYSKAKDAVESVVIEVKEWGRQYTGTDEKKAVEVSGIAAGGDTAEATEANETAETAVEEAAEAVPDEAEARSGAVTGADTVAEEDTANGKAGSGIA
ncbi:YtxH domain-containing protein [Paenibacillus riograndensis]|uniref:Putative membrane protein n=1 Tax=Paenibacillus riograndensis SBR5 TaxID=1073571 RepID=A0A0E4H972_9BACL|nr:YtxH domain-containing protein [Paenibacillus riograndensis]CQR54916.1 putative membrane protein [Paenibacillus riograndensis SBR5]